MSVCIASFVDHIPFPDYKPTSVLSLLLSGGLFVADPGQAVDYNLPLVLMLCLEYHVTVVTISLSYYSSKSAITYLLFASARGAFEYIPGRYPAAKFKTNYW